MHWLPVDNHAARVDEGGGCARVPFSIRTKHACGAHRHQLEMQSAPLSWHPGWGRGVVRGTGAAVVWWDSRVNVIVLGRSRAASPGPRPPSNLDTLGKTGPSGRQWRGLILSTAPSPFPSVVDTCSESVYWSSTSLSFRILHLYDCVIKQECHPPQHREISVRKCVGRGTRRTDEGNI